MHVLMSPVSYDGMENPREGIVFNSPKAFGEFLFLVSKEMSDYPLRLSCYPLRLSCL